MCNVGLPQVSSPECKGRREQGLQAERQLYRLGYRPPLPMPLLDSTPRRLFAQLSQDPFAQMHANLYIGTLQASGRLLETRLKLHPEEITQYRGYAAVFDFFKSHLQDPKVSKLLMNSH